MLRDGDREREILLGNRQLLGIFFLVVVLLGVAFGGGYKLGQGSRKTNSAAEPAGTSGANSGAAETRTVGAESPPASNTETSGSQTSTSETASPAADSSTEPALGAPHRAKAQPIAPAQDSEAAAPPSALTRSQTAYTPQPGQTFLQVAAVSRDEAEGIADVLRRKGLRAHSVPKPGSKLYRVIIGPMRDAGDLNSTRNLLHNMGFREIFIQRY